MNAKLLLTFGFVPVSFVFLTQAQSVGNGSSAEERAGAFDRWPQYVRAPRAESGPVALALNVPTVDGVTNQVSITVEGEYRVIRANGIPDHTPGAFPNPHNPNRIAPQTHLVRVPLNPKAGSRPISSNGAWFGIALNGVPFEPGTAEFWNREWKYEAMGGTMNLGLDDNLAHVQPTGAYHYHGLPPSLIANRGGDKSGMLQIGWAADGFPIYTNVGYTDPKDAKSARKTIHASYQLKKGERPGSPNGPGGKYDGSFTADWEYVKGSGDLDECNGRFGVTPEYPQGVYHYYVTAEFPFLARLWNGTPDPSFQKGPGGPGGPGGRGRKGPPPGGGFGPRPGGPGGPGGFGPPPREG